MTGISAAPSATPASCGASPMAGANAGSACASSPRDLASRRQALLVATPQLSGEVEVDESYFGGARSGKRGRGAAGKRPVFGLLKRGGCVRVVFPERLGGATLKGAIREHVEPHSWVYSDGFSSCDGLHLEGFHHERIDHSQTLGQGRRHINGIENFWCFAKRRLKMYHGGAKGNFPLFLLEMELSVQPPRRSASAGRAATILLPEARAKKAPKL